MITTRRIPKTNTNAWKVEWFYAYCLKIIIAEKSLSRFKAKGLLDRALQSIRSQVNPNWILRRSQIHKVIGN